MRVQLLSDLHLEFQRDHGRALLNALATGADVLVLAGDVLPLRFVDEIRATLGWFASRYPHVVFVPGNHEYYRTSPLDAHAALERATSELANVHVLNPGVVEIDGVRFAGATLWFPEAPDEAVHRMLVNDFRAIEGFVPWVHQTHAEHLAFLEREVKRADVVVTHHLPHENSVSPEYRESPSNRFYLARDAQPLVGSGKARLWLHGHTHTPADYVVGSTRVVCNPVGYPGEAKAPANLAMALEV